MAIDKDFLPTDPHKLHRTDAPDTSIAAAHTVDTATDRKVVYNHFQWNFPRGLTSKELVPIMGKSLNTFSGRLSELLEQGLIEDTGERRDKCRILRWIDKG